MKLLSTTDAACLATIITVFLVTGAIVNRMDKPVEVEEVPPVEIIQQEEVQIAPLVREVEEEAESEPVSLGEFKMTAYCACVKCCGIWSAEHPSRGADYVQRTASGTIPEQGRTVAADWSVLPEGTEVIINGQTYTVEDTGSGVDGKHIDVFFESHQEALEWGVQIAEVFSNVCS